MEKVLEEIKFMSYDELYQVLDAVNRRMAKLDKHEDMRRAEIEDWSEDNDDE